MVNWFLNFNGKFITDSINILNISNKKIQFTFYYQLLINDKKKSCISETAIYTCV